MGGRELSFGPPNALLYSPDGCSRVWGTNLRQLITGSSQSNHKNKYLSRLLQLTKHFLTSIIGQEAYNSPA